MKEMSKTNSGGADGVMIRERCMPAIVVWSDYGGFLSLLARDFIESPQCPVRFINPRQ